MGLFSSKPAAPAASDLRRERRALLLLREDRLRELGGLTLEMYRRDHFNETLIVERCAELVAIEARASEIDALLQGARGLRRRGAAICACGAPILMGARFCPSCGRNLIDDARRPVEAERVTRCPRCGEARRGGPGVLPRMRAAAPRCVLASGRRPRAPGRSRSRSSSRRSSPCWRRRRGDRAHARHGDSDADRHGDRRQRGSSASPTVADEHTRPTWPREAATPGRTSSSRFPRSTAATRRSPAPSRRGGGACDRSACSIRRASRASIPATGWSSPGVYPSEPEATSRLREAKACRRGAPHRPHQPLIRCLK